MLRLLAKIAGAMVGLLAVFTGIPVLLRLLEIPLEEFLATPRALLVWPVAALIIGLVFLVRYRDAIDHVIRYGRFRLPGGVEIASQQSPEPAKDAVGDGRKLTPEQEAQLTSFIEQLQTERQSATQQAEQLQGLYQQELANSVLWEFRYLDLFLVPKTKLVLHWFTQIPSITRAGFETTWKELIPEEGQLTVILQVLLSHALIVDQGDNLQISPKGRAFLGSLGMPQQPRAAPAGA